MRRPAEKPDQAGFTLAEMMITVVVASMILTVLAKLFLGSWYGWMFNTSALLAQRNSRTVRDSIVKTLRQASAATVQITAYNAYQPPRSMISFTDAAGVNWCYFQKGNTIHVGQWTAGAGGVRTVNAGDNTIVPDKVKRLQFYYPNLKDMRNVQFQMYLYWQLLGNNALQPVSIQLVGDVQIRDP